MFVGFDGWYSKCEPNTNDIRFTTFATRENLFNNCRRRIMEILNDDYKNFKIKILVTHFPSYSHNQNINFCNDLSLQNIFTAEFDYLFTGHSHYKDEFQQNNCKVFNAGSDYDNPNFHIIEINILKKE